ncbi:hypothetical protein [Stackebrandtia nassauensis]|uniref:Uncharacterized protein n=1 Tax=Stackebrandtia nassauensis (strain DSM 44728 / CIP 108903 / NRRL B-16338 / NBRC 102104 / LLR-40K-21) TaxID=446470 RepID=D3Q0H9_STANL|nr:hypothetical protein [Stackebrandtia nassauensis]ADD41715.1 hypothetical protein Snas_2020 [Stackebrandtia nassauensis DSM 44728]
MGVVGDQLDAVEVQAISPDGEITVKLGTGDAVDVQFKSDEYFKSVPHETLSHQLGRALTLLAVGRIRKRHQILEAEGFEVYGEDDAHWDKRVRVFREKRAQVKAAGRSPKRHIAIATVGLRDFKVRFERDVTRRLSRSEFSGEFGGAVAAVISEYSAQMTQLKTAMFT